MGRKKTGYGDRNKGHNFAFKTTPASNIHHFNPIGQDWVYLVTQLQGRLGNEVFNLTARCPVTILDLSTVEEENRYWGQPVIIATGSLWNWGKGSPATFALVTLSLLVQAKSVWAVLKDFHYNNLLFLQPLPLWVVSSRLVHHGRDSASPRGRGGVCFGSLALGWLQQPETCLWRAARHGWLVESAHVIYIARDPFDSILSPGQTWEFTLLSF